LQESGKTAGIEYDRNACHHGTSLITQFEFRDEQETHRELQQESRSCAAHQWKHNVLRLTKLDEWHHESISQGSRHQPQACAPAAISKVFSNGNKDGCHVEANHTYGYANQTQGKNCSLQVDSHQMILPCSIGLSTQSL
jgi:hypothetical protein